MPDTKQVTPNPVGRPTKYNLEIAVDICTQIAEGNSLNSICKKEDLPTIKTVYNWMIKYPDFLHMYEKAKEDQADTLADEIMDIADEIPEKIILRGEGDKREEERSIDPSGIQRNRLRVDARKWIASKLKPRKYGDRAIVTGENGEDIQINIKVQAKELMDQVLQNIELKS